MTRATVNMRCLFALTALAVLPLLALQPAHAIELVTNGGFETGDFSGWSLAADPSFNFVNVGFTHSGTYAAWFGEFGQLGSLTQSLATTVGTEYTLSFWFAGDGDDPSQFQALVDGSILFDVVNPPFDVNYQNYTFDFTATSTATDLTFKFRDDPFYINLDDVSVVEKNPPSGIPEPGTLALLGLALPAIGLVRRRS